MPGVTSVVIVGPWRLAPRSRLLGYPYPCPLYLATPLQNPRRTRTSPFIFSCVRIATKYGPLSIGFLKWSTSLDSGGKRKTVYKNADGWLAAKYISFMPHCTCPIRSTNHNIRLWRSLLLSGKDMTYPRHNLVSNIGEFVPLIEFYSFHWGKIKNVPLNSEDEISI